MGKDLIIGGASNYNWDQLKHWVNSIKRSGFTGDIVIVSNSMKKETVERLDAEGVKLALYGKVNENGDLVPHTNGAPHVERFFYIWNYLNDHADEYDFVISTDTRDVVFQTNPTPWIDEMIFAGRESVIVSSEGMTYENEPWNDTNLLQAFGPYFHNHYKGMIINNVGVLAGEAPHMRDLFFMIFQMSINRPIPIVDQVVFNVLLQQKPFRDVMKQTYNCDGWAIQLGTTTEAVKSGAGDLGAMITSNPDGMDIYEKLYFDVQPKLREDGVVVNEENKPFVIVHQYDRTKEWSKKIMERYE